MRSLPQHASSRVTLGCLCRLPQPAARLVPHCRSRPAPLQRRVSSSSSSSSSGGNGSTPRSPAGLDDADDPMAALLWAARESGGTARVLDASTEADEEDLLEDLEDDLEDPWMRHPSAPEWSEAPVFGGVAGAMASSSSDADNSSVGVPERVATVTWQQLCDRLAAAGPEQPAVVLAVLPDEQQQQQQLPDRGSSEAPPVQPAARPLPDPLPLQLSGRASLEVVRLGLAALDRDTADRWRQQGAVVAVWSSGHHSCLAAAIRLSAVWRLADAVVLVA